MTKRTVGLYLNYAVTDPGDIKHVCFSDAPDGDKIYMMDLNNKIAISIDKNNVYYNSPHKYHGQKMESYSTVQSKLSDRQKIDVNRILTQTYSHVCIPRPIDTSYQFKNIDFNPSARQSSLSFMNGCDSSYTACQYDPQDYYISGIQQPVCAKKQNVIWKHIVSFTNITKPESKVQEFNAMWISDGTEFEERAQPDFSKFFYEKVKRKKSGVFDDFDAPQYFWHGTMDLKDPATTMMFDGSAGQTWTVAITQYSQSLFWPMQYTLKYARKIVVIKAQNPPKTSNRDIEFHQLGMNIDNSLYNTTKVIARYGYSHTSAPGFRPSKYSITSYPDALIFMKNAAKKYQLEVDTVFHLHVNGRKWPSGTNFQGWITSPLNICPNHFMDADSTQHSKTINLKLILLSIISVCMSLLASNV